MVTGLKTLFTLATPFPSRFPWLVGIHLANNRLLCWYWPYFTLSRSLSRSFSLSQTTDLFIYIINLFLPSYPRLFFLRLCLPLLVFLFFLFLSSFFISIVISLLCLSLFPFYIYLHFLSLSLSPPSLSIAISLLSLYSCLPHLSTAISLLFLSIALEPPYVAPQSLHARLQDPHWGDKSVGLLYTDSQPSCPCG